VPQSTFQHCIGSVDQERDGNYQVICNEYIMADQINMKQVDAQARIAALVVRNKQPEVVDCNIGSVGDYSGGPTTASTGLIRVIRVIKQRLVVIVIDWSTLIREKRLKSTLELESSLLQVVLWVYLSYRPSSCFPPRLCLPIESRHTTYILL